jgi:serine/threonine protein phosphatase PrpC
MEDRVVTGPVTGGLVVGVFDGHGGSAVAEYAAARALQLVEAAMALGLRTGDLWGHVFAGLDPDVEACGSTATLLFLHDRELSAGWVGDSRALLVTDTGWQVITPEHRIGRDDERRRVVGRGALIEPPYVVHPTFGHGLMMTRTLGDRELRGIGVIAEPEVATASLGESDMGFVAATDGLWDVVTDEEAATACRGSEPEAAAERLVEMVVRRDGADNVTVVVGRFR